MKMTDKDRLRMVMKKKESEFMKTAKVKFPVCIGKFPECREYTEDMPFEDRDECRTCPHGLIKK